MALLGYFTASKLGVIIATVHRHVIAHWTISVCLVGVLFLKRSVLRLSGVVYMEFFVCFDQFYKMAKKHDGVRKIVIHFFLNSVILRYSFQKNLFYGRLLIGYWSWAMNQGLWSSHRSPASVGVWLKFQRTLKFFEPFLVIDPFNCNRSFLKFHIFDEISCQIGFLVFTGWFV